MNKAELIRDIAEKTTTKKTEVERVLDALADIVRTELATPGGMIMLPGLGKIEAVSRPARPGRNPKTGEAVEIPARKAVKFKPSGDLKASLNG